MCGRYTLHLPDLSALIAHFGVKRVFVPDWKPRYNIAPTQLAPVVVAREPRGGRKAERSLELLRFGLVPPYARAEAAARAKAPGILVNARVETVAKLGAFRSAYQRRRCLVPATGFYEWMEVAGRRTKQPMWMHPEQGELLTFAGVYEPGVDEHGEVVDTFAIVTTEPTPELSEIHDRMPLVLTEDGARRWLENAAPSPAELSALTGQVSAIALRIDPVSSAVSSPRNDEPRCIEPLTEAEVARTQLHADLAEQLDLFGSAPDAPAPAPAKRVLTSAKRRAH